MFARFFKMLREKTRDAILGGFQDASDSLNSKVENHEPILIEMDAAEPSNGKPRRKAVAK